MAVGGDWVLMWGAKVNESIAQGQYWRFITANFLHGGVGHLLVRGTEAGVVDRMGIAMDVLPGFQFSCRWSEYLSSFDAYHLMLSSARACFGENYAWPENYNAPLKDSLDLSSTKY